MKYSHHLLFSNIGKELMSRKQRGLNLFSCHFYKHREMTIVLSLVRECNDFTRYPGWKTSCNSDSTLKKNSRSELSATPFLCSSLLPIMMQSPKQCKHSKSIHIFEITRRMHISMGSSFDWEPFKNRFQEQQVNLAQLVLNFDKTHN